MIYIGVAKRNFLFLEGGREGEAKTELRGNTLYNIYISLSRLTIKYE